MPAALDRRRFLQAGLAAAAAAAAGPRLFDRDAAWAVAAAAAGDGVFGYGVASGDPLATAVVIWTRVTPSPDAVPGSGAGASTDVSWELAADEEFRTVLRTGSARTSPESDHTVKVDVTGLQPYTRYFYRFRAAGETSPTGRTQTSPDLPGEVSALRLGVVSCSNFTGGYFAAYREMGLRDDLDVVLHLGDYLYEYGNGADRYGPDELAGERDHEPGHETIALSDYRLRFATYRADPDLALAHRRHPWITIFDDHEVTNDTWREGAENHDPDGDDARPGVPEGDFLTRRAFAYQAYREWLPIRDDPGGNVFYRRFGFGPLADLHVVDTRTFRDEQLDLESQGRRADPAREFLGPQQRAWLFDGLREGRGQRQWRLLGNQTVLTPVELPRPLPEPLASSPGLVDSPFPGPGFAFNPDQWDGYEAERNRLKALIVEEGLSDVVVLTGDIHSSWANDVPLDEGTYAPVGPANNSLLVEFVTPSVTSDNVDEIAGDPGGPAGIAASRSVEAAFQASNPHIRFLDFEKHGYGVLDVTPIRAQFDWFWLRSDTETDPRLDPDAEVYYGTSWQTLAGSSQVSPAAGPVGPRADEPRPATAAPEPEPEQPAPGGTAPVTAPREGASRGSGSTAGTRARAGGAGSAAGAGRETLPATGGPGALGAVAAVVAGGALALRRRLEQ